MFIVFAVSDPEPIATLRVDDQNSCLPKSQSDEVLGFLSLW